jgi:DMSO/TMAO reductase YedYZ molybdopterin-dependent catalytic subunit
MGHSEPPTDADPSEWAVRVQGAVADPIAVRATDLPATAVVETGTDCDGADAADRWEGVYVTDLFDPTTEATHALVRSVDPDYACGFALDDLAGAVLAVEVDGDPIPTARGGPVRLLPGGDGVDCWERVKWVTEIEVLDGPPEEGDTARERVPAVD